MSATIEAKTKGIWIWCVPHPTVKGRCLALMDTEGLGDPMKVCAVSGRIACTQMYRCGLLLYRCRIRIVCVSVCMPVRDCAKTAKSIETQLGIWCRPYNFAIFAMQVSAAV